MNGEEDFVGYAFGCDYVSHAFPKTIRSLLHNRAYMYMYVSCGCRLRRLAIDRLRAAAFFTRSTVATCHSLLCFQAITAPYEQVYPAEEYDNKDVDDNCKLRSRSNWRVSVLQIRPQNALETAHCHCAAARCSNYPFCTNSPVCSEIVTSQANKGRQCRTNSERVKF